MPRISEELVQVLPRQRPGPQHRLARQGTEFARHFERSRADLRCLAKLVDQPDAQRCRRVDECATREQLCGMAANKSPKRTVDGRPRKQPYLHFIESQPEISESHYAIVTVNRHDRAAGRAVTGDPENDGHGGMSDGALRTPHFDEQRGHGISVQFQHAAHVETRGKDSRLTSDNQSRLPGTGGDCLPQLVQKLQVQRVDGGTRQAQFANATGLRRGASLERMIDDLQHGHSPVSLMINSRSTVVAKLPADSANRKRRSSPTSSYSRSRTRRRAGRRSAFMRSAPMTVNASGNRAAVASSRARTSPRASDSPAPGNGAVG